MSQFSKFCDVQSFTNGLFVLSREHYSKEEACEIFTEYLQDNGYLEEGEVVQPESISMERVRWCFNRDEQDDVPRLAWWLVDTVRGTKPVWVWG